jgi:hypothetical protein
LIQNNIITGMGRFLPAGEPVYILNSHNNLVDHNTIYDTYNAAISAGATYAVTANVQPLAHDNIVQFNLIYDVGQGVTSDMGGVYMAIGTAQGNKMLNNVVHDVTHDPGNPAIPSSAGYGGWGLYFDAGSRNVLAANNLVYRTSQTSVHNNLGEGNRVTNNILAFGAQGVIDRSLDNTALSLTFDHNIVLWDRNSPQGSLLRGSWSCIDSYGNPVSCSERFLFYNNLYWYTPGNPTFMTTQPTKLYTFQQWQALEEDANSLIANPMFSNPNYPADNFTIPDGSPSLTLGFVPFSPNQAGRFPGATLTPLPVPPAFPLQLLDVTSF